MSFRGMLIKAGIDSNGTDIKIFNGYLKLNKANILYFRDTSTFIYSSEAGTLRIEATTLILSGAMAFAGDMEVTGDLTVGTSGERLVLTAAANRAIDVYVDYSGTGPSWAVNFDETMGTDGCTGGVFRSTITFDAIRPGSYSMNAQFRSDYTSVTTTAGFGMGAGLMVELINPSAAWGGGQFHVMALEWTGASATAMHGNAAIPSSFIKFETWGTAAADVDDHGYLFYLSGVTIGGSHLVQAAAVAGVDSTHAIKINILGVEYFIPIHTSAGFA